MSRTMLLLSLLVSGVVTAQENAVEQAPPTQAAEAAGGETPAAEPEQATQAAAEEPGGVKTLSGMSILGNEEAPKSLVIVPWKSSRLGDGLGVTNSIDDRARPVDKEVFMREVHYYELRAGAETGSFE